MATGINKNMCEKRHLSVLSFGQAELRRNSPQKIQKQNIDDFECDDGLVGISSE